MNLIMNLPVMKDVLVKNVVEGEILILVSNATSTTR